jgi:thioredoxin-related protein
VFNKIISLKEFAVSGEHCTLSVHILNYYIVMMRLITVSAFLFFVSVSLHAQTGIKFNTDFKNAFSNAKKENKKVMIYFYADNCPACDYLQEEFSNTSLGNLYNKSFVNYKFNGNTGGKRAAEYYNVYSFPTMLFIANDGDPVYSLRGYREGKEIFDAGKMARRNGRDIKRLMDKKYKDDPEDTDHLYNYIEYQMVRGNFGKANKYSKEYLNLRDKIDDTEWMNFVLDYASDPTTYAHTVLLQEKDKFYKQYGREIVDPIIFGSILYEQAEKNFTRNAREQERAFLRSAASKGFKPDDSEVRMFYYNYLFTNPRLTVDGLSAKDRELHTKYALFALENGTEKVDRETLLRTAIYLLKYHQKQSTMSNLNDALDNRNKQTPNYGFLDMQSVVLYSLGQEELAVEKIQQARELAVSSGVRDYRPSVTAFKKQGIIK